MPRAFHPDSTRSGLSGEKGLPGKKALRILVVEDDDDSREMMVQLLRLLGSHSIAVAENGETALDLLRSNETYDLLITDVGLPGIDGIEMLDRAVKEGLIAVEHIVICSAHMSPKFDARARGAVCIPKPVDTNQIIRTVRSVAAQMPNKP